MIKYTPLNRNGRCTHVQGMHSKVASAVRPDKLAFLRSLQTTSSFLRRSVNCEGFFLDSHIGKSRTIRRKLDGIGKVFRSRSSTSLPCRLCLNWLVCWWSIYCEKMYRMVEVLRSVIGDNYRVVFNNGAKVAFVIVLMDSPLDSVVINVIFTCVSYMQTAYSNHRYNLDLY